METNRADIAYRLGVDPEDIVWTEDNGWTIDGMPWREWHAEMNGE